MFCYCLASKHDSPAWRLLLLPSPYVSWDADEREFSVGLELWNSYVEVIFNFNPEEDL